MAIHEKISANALANGRASVAPNKRPPMILPIACPCFSTGKMYDTNGMIIGGITKETHNKKQKSKNRNFALMKANPKKKQTGQTQQADN